MDKSRNKTSKDFPNNVSIKTKFSPLFPHVIKLGKPIIFFRRYKVYISFCNKQSFTVLFSVFIATFSLVWIFWPEYIVDCDPSPIFFLTRYFLNNSFPIKFLFCILISDLMSSEQLEIIGSF